MDVTLGVAVYMYLCYDSSRKNSQDVYDSYTLLITGQVFYSFLLCLPMTSHKSSSKSMRRHLHALALFRTYLHDTPAADVPQEYQMSVQYLPRRCPSVG